MLDDYKYSIGRLVVYRHPNPRLPRQSYGQHGHERTVGEIMNVDMVPHPEPHWVYSIRNARNQEVTRVEEEQIKFATAVGKYYRRNQREAASRIEDGALAEMIAKALSNPERQGILHSSLRDFMHKEELAARASRDGADLPLYVGDYVRVRGDLRKETAELHNHYAKILSVQPSDIAGIENPQSKPGQPTLFRTLKKFRVVSCEGVEADVYDAEIKLFYTAHARKTIFNWRAATFLAETFKDQPPYNLEHEFLSEHIFTRDELKPKKRSELATLLATLLYVKGKMGLRDYQRRNQFFAGTPKSHLTDNIIEASRFDAKRNRVMTRAEITGHQQEGYKLRRLLKSR